jgi:hypothetical protein
MKTLIFRNAANTTRVEVKVDIFPTVAEMQVAGFDTKFTAMEITDTPAAIALGINVNEIDYSYASMVAMAQGIAGVGLFVIDNTKLVNETKVAQVDSVTLTGTSGTANIKVNATNYLATFDTNLSTTANNFVSTHTAALSSAGITVTHPGSDGKLIFTAVVAGVAFDITDDIENVSGNLDGIYSSVSLNNPGNGEVTLVAP